MQPAQICWIDKLLSFFSVEIILFQRGELLTRLRKNSHLKKKSVWKNWGAEKIGDFSVSGAFEVANSKVQKKNPPNRFCFFFEEESVSVSRERPKSNAQISWSLKQKLFRKYFLNFSKNKSMQMATSFLKIEKKRNSDCFSEFSVSWFYGRVMVL